MIVLQPVVTYSMISVEFNETPKLGITVGSTTLQELKVRFWR